MSKEKTLISCYGFWPGVEDGKSGDGSPRTVYCIIEDKAMTLKFSDGEVSDLLTPETVRRMYGPCSLEQMICYIEEAKSAKGGGLGIDFETSVFADIVACPDRYASGEEVPVRWKDYFVVPPKKGRGAGRREDEVRGYLLAVKVDDYAVQDGLSVEKKRTYRNRAKAAQNLLRTKVREYRSSAQEKREALRQEIIKGLRDLEQALHLLGIPISDTEKGSSRSVTEGVVRVGGGIEVRKPGKNPVREKPKGAGKRKFGIVAYKKVEPQPTLGRTVQSLTSGQRREKAVLERRIRKLESRIELNEAILRENRSPSGARKKLLDELGVARADLKTAKELLSALLYGVPPIPEVSDASQVVSLPESDGVGSVVAVSVGEGVEAEANISIEEPAQGGVVLPFPHAAHPSDVDGVDSAASEEFVLDAVGSEAFQAFSVEMEGMRAELESLLATLQAQFQASGDCDDEILERFRTLNARKGDTLRNLRLLSDKMAVMFPPCRGRP